MPIPETWEKALAEIGESPEEYERFIANIAAMGLVPHSEVLEYLLARVTYLEAAILHLRRTVKEQDEPNA